MKFIPVFILILYAPLYGARTIYFTPGQWGELFNIDNSYLNADDQQMPMHLVKQTLEQHGFIIKQTNSLKNLEDVHCIITFDIPVNQLSDLLAYPQEKCFAFLWEPPSVIPSNYQALYHQFFAYVYTWHDDLIDNSKYKKFYYPVMHPMIENTVPFHERKLCALIAGNKNSFHPNELYSERRYAIEYFETRHCDDFDLYGRWWPAYKNYCGPIWKKIDVLKNYKFCICYENIKDIPGYITEKIFDCFRCGCVPIYWGANNITDYIPAHCFIDRNQFANYDELYEYLHTMNEETFEEYLINIRNYLNSPPAQLYSTQNFVSILVALAISLKEKIN